jgi:NodT family efflux transporter outer membrane factor (OMF) lipoprotein
VFTVREGGKLDFFDDQAARKTFRLLFRVAGGRLFLLIVLLLGVTFHFACRSAGPDYKKPVVVPPPQWQAQMAEGLTARNSDELLARWWMSLDDPLLQSLIERAIQGNLDLRRATAVVREARARRAVAEAGRFPTLSSAGLTSLRRGSDRMGSSATLGLFSTGFDAGWEMDIFGGVRRSIEAAEASLEASDELLRDVLVSLAAEVAINYVEVRQYQTQLGIAEDNLRLQEDSYRLASQRYEAGLTTRLDVDQARYSVAGTRSRIPALRTKIEQAKNRVAVLMGMNPGELAGELRESGRIPVGPLEIAVGVPADALRRRPDVRRAERVLAARSAGVGVATSARYPRFYLPGAIGYDAITRGNPLALGNLIGSLGSSVFFTIFDAGRIRQNIEVQDAMQEQALVGYESAIIFALEEAENALTAHSEEQLRRRALAEAVEAAQQAVELVQANYAAGLVDFLPVLESQRSLLSFQDQLAQCDGFITTSLIRVYKALGGGWQPLSPSVPISSSQQQRTGQKQ